MVAVKIAKPVFHRPKLGDVLAIPLGDGSYGFGQVAAGGDYAFFDLRSEQVLPVEDIVAHTVVFRVHMAGGSAKAGRWLLLGNASLRGRLSESIGYRNQPVGSNQLNILKDNRVIPATYDEVKDLEVMSWWFEQHIVQRLLDHFEGRPNLEFESARQIKVYDPQTGAELDSTTGKEIKRGPSEPALTRPGAAFATTVPDKPEPTPKPATAVTLSKLRGLVDVYEQLVALLQHAGDERLKLYVDSVEGALSQLKALIAAGVDAKTSREMVKGVRQGLREMPQLLSSLVPERSKQLVADIEGKLGRSFSDY